MAERRFNPSPAALRAALREYPDGCTTLPWQVTYLRYAFVLGYAAGQKAIRKRRPVPQHNQQP